MPACAAIPMIRRLLDSIAFSVFPQKCASCDNYVERLELGKCCTECWAATRRFGIGETICDKCGKLLATDRTTRKSSCGECYDFAFDTARAAMFYERAAAATVIAMKVEPHLPSMAKQHLIEGFHRSGLGLPDLVLPVPLSKKRRLERRFNQAEIIASVLASALSVRCDAESLRRIRHSHLHRAGMDRIAREATVKDAFRVLRPKLVAGRNLLIVDDVLTTGVSAAYCAAALKLAGADRVDVFTFSRAI